LKASINWLKEFVEFSLPPEKVAEALTMAGLEVEGLDESGDDYILDISVTPNRPDCLSIVGIARELSAILKLPFRYAPAPVENEEGVRPLIDIKDAVLCPRYSSRIIRGAEVKPSPEWISKRLEAHGIRTANNIVDITNYVLLEMGHPLHAFDLDRLEGGRIVVGRAGKENRLKTLDNETRKLKGDMLLIWDAKKPVAVAGVMGGLNSEVTSSTKNILLESAYFDPRSIRRTSRALNLSTEASYRFERGADIRIVIPALDRVAGLIGKIAGGNVTRTTDIYTRPYIPDPIPVSLMKINNILGTRIKPAQVQEILSGLEIENTLESSPERPYEDKVIVTPPSFRQDLQRDVDVIEEIARLYGYEKIPSTLPRVEMKPVDENLVRKLLNRVRESMRKSGYSEAINYSFLNPLSLDKLGLPSGDRRRSLTRIRNPLKKEDEALRTTLVPALLENVRFNMNRGVKSLRLFELSSVFLESGQKLPDEVLKLSAVYVKDNRASLWQMKHDGFYDIARTIPSSR
jgi:phenylalanyl-tRNA synthetase beta chain